MPGPYSTDGTATTGSSLALTTADGPSRLTFPWLPELWVVSTGDTGAAVCSGDAEKPGP